MTDTYSSTLLYKKITELVVISDVNLEMVFRATSPKPLSKGEIVLGQGQFCKNIIFVEKGGLRTFIDKNGDSINVDFTFEGGFTTNVRSLRSGSPSDTTIQATARSTVYEFSSDALLDLYKISPAIESFGRKILEQLLMAQEEHANLFTMYSARERYQYLQAHKPEMLQRISLTQLASYLGVARETLSRIRKK